MARFMLIGISLKRNINTKLSDVDIEQIKSLLKEGKLTQKQIAKKFKTSQTHVSNILNNKRRRSSISSACAD